MSVLSMGRRRARPWALYSLAGCGFLAVWCLLTLLIVALEDRLLGPPDAAIRRRLAQAGSAARGVQVVVGHYSGSLRRDRTNNLTEGGFALWDNAEREGSDEIDANRLSPVEGVGELGHAVQMSVREEVEAEKTFGINQFNVYISDKIALNRSLPDVRKSQCRAKQYPAPSQLPTTSVIIVYHNEAFSTLLRTVTSVINRSPRECLEEIILVDDYSTRKFLKKELEDALRVLPVRTKLIRAKQRVGLIRARLMGAAEADGQVLTFLDSHCECTKGWLEPLLARIKESRRSVVCPIIDVINDQTFAYQKGIELFRGGFNWNLQFRWYAVPPKVAQTRAKDPTLPILSPTMAGGLFSIDREYFEKLGTYDSGMDIWGGENIEMSFRVWQCGGSVEILPCSHVGHIFRKASPHDFPRGSNSATVLNGNLIRVVEVWMDQWKHLFYKTSPQAVSMRKAVDVSDRVELRKRLHCKSFRWYLQNVWPEHFLPMPENKTFGRMAHPASAHCLQNKPGLGAGARRTLSHGPCTLGFDLWQLWIHDPGTGQLKSDEHMCLSAQKLVNADEYAVQLKECGEHEHEFWDWVSYRSQLVHRQSGLCLDEPLEGFSDPDSVRVPTVRSCSRYSDSQRWELRPVEWLPDPSP